MVESMNTRRMSPNRGSAVSASNSAFRLPDATHRRKRLYTASQEPNSAGRSRHGTPVRARYKSASKNARSGRVGAGPWRFFLAAATAGPRAAQRLSEIMYRMASCRGRGSTATPYHGGASSVNTA